MWINRLATASLLFILTGASLAYGDSPVITLGTSNYIYRWSQGDMYEFTPQDQKDLSSWKDMLSIIILPKGSDSKTLMLIANNLNSQYERSGRIIHTNSIPQTASSEAEHLIVGMLRAPALLETIFTRIKMTDKERGIMIIWSHRIYGKNSDDEMATWLEKNGSAREDLLMSLQEIPDLESIGK